jgi:PIN domain
MEHIILDTNVFLKENFLEGKRIIELLKLSEEGKIKIVLTIITVEEVKNNFKKLITQALSNLATFKKAYESRALRNNSIGKSIYAKLDKDQIIKGFNDDLDAILKKSKVTIIEYSELNIQGVFEKYFKSEYPFNGTEKKSEFPDAFALELIEKWCRENKQKCRVFSSDKDFLNFKSIFLEISSNYETYLDEKLKFYLNEQHRIGVLEKLFIHNSHFIDESVKNWYIDKLYDEGLYYPVIYYEIHKIEVVSVDILNKSYKIIAIEDEAIEIEVEVELIFKVELLIDDEEYSHYDDEEKTIHYFETKGETIEQTTKAKLLVVGYIIDDNDYEQEFEIIEINKDRELKIEYDYYDH